MSVNPIRGEVVIKIGSLELILVITMAALSRISAASGYPALHELHRRLASSESATAELVIVHCTEKGTLHGKNLSRDDAVFEAMQRWTINDLMEMQDTMVGLMASLTRKTEGKSPQGNGESAPSR